MRLKNKTKEYQTLNHQYSIPKTNDPTRYYPESTVSRKYYRSGFRICKPEEERRELPGRLPFSQRENPLDDRQSGQGYF